MKKLKGRKLNQKENTDCSFIEDQKKFFLIDQNQDSVSLSSSIKLKIENLDSS